MTIIAFNMLLLLHQNYQNIKSYPERVSNLKPFINQYDWKEIDLPSHQKSLD